jgi:excisionase family DNA binding protein
MQGKKGKKWTSEEEAMLEAMAGEIPPRKIAKKLNRRYGTVFQKASRMGISLEMETNNFTINGLSRLLGVDPSTVFEWIKNGQLKAPKLGNQTSRRTISRKAFKRFYETYGGRKQSLKHIPPETIQWLTE